MSLHRDPRAPVRLSTEDKQLLHQDSEIKTLSERVNSLRRDVLLKYGRIKKGRGTSLHTEFEKAKDALRAEFSYKERTLRKTIRERYFRSIGTIELNRQSSTSVESSKVHQEAKIVQAHYTFKERYRLTTSLFKPLDLEETSRSTISKIRAQAISDLTSLCFRREMRQRTRTRSMQKTSFQSLDVNSRVEASDEQDDRETLSHYPLVCSENVCLFCLGNASLCYDDRVKDYKRKDTLQKHLQRGHLKFIKKDAKIRCGHPTCEEFVLDNVEHFKNHAATVHHIFL